MDALDVETSIAEADQALQRGDVEFAIVSEWSADGRHDDEWKHRHDRF